MRVYDLGLEDDDDIGNPFVDVRMPGDILAEMKTIDAVVKALDTEIHASKVSSEFKASWAGFAGEWRRFFAEHEGWTSRLWYAAYEKTLEYRKRLGEWRAAFVHAGGQTIAPELPTREEPSHFPWLLLGGLVVGGAVTAFAVHKIRQASYAARVAEVLS